MVMLNVVFRLLYIIFLYYLKKNSYVSHHADYEGAVINRKSKEERNNATSFQLDIALCQVSCVLAQSVFVKGAKTHRSNKVIE